MKKTNNLEKTSMTQLIINAKIDKQINQILSLEDK